MALDTMEILKSSGLLTPQNQEMIEHQAAPEELAYILSALNQAGILTQENFERLRVCSNLQMLSYGVCNLNSSKILTQINFERIAVHTDPEKTAEALSYLSSSGILSDMNRDLVFAHHDPASLSWALYNLNSTRILTQLNFDTLTHHPYSFSLIEAIYSLEQAKILTQKNFDVVSHHPQLKNLYISLILLEESAILNQANFDALVAPNHSPLLTPEAIVATWDRIPDCFLEQEHFDRLLLAAEYENPMDALRRVTDQILSHSPDIAAPIFNPGQSAHAASVHRSVIKLKTNYDAHFELESKIKEIQDAINALDDTPKHLAAKRCIQRITGPEDVFHDTAEVSIRQLLALTYMGIHDASKRYGSLDDAKILFVEGLYEIQRGNNLSATGVDDGNTDAPISQARTFDKLVEKLNGIHQDVDIYLMTHEGATSKFRKLVQHHTREYLSTFTAAKSIEEYDAVSALLMALETTNRVELIWPQIAKPVEDELWAEFSEAFANDKENPLFTNLLAFGSKVEIPNLQEMKKQLQDSLGYQLHLAHISFNASGAGMFARSPKDDEPDHKRQRVNPSA